MANTTRYVRSVSIPTASDIPVLHAVIRPGTGTAVSRLGEISVGQRDRNTQRSVTTYRKRPRDPVLDEIRPVVPKRTSPGLGGLESARSG